MESWDAIRRRLSQTRKSQVTRHSGVPCDRGVETIERRHTKLKYTNVHDQFFDVMKGAWR